MHPNEALLRRLYDSRAARDETSLAAALAPDVVWHVPGRSAIAGNYRGIEEVLRYMRRRLRLSDGTFQVAVHDMLANDAYRVVIASGRAVRQGQSLEWRTHGLFRFNEARIAECWVLPEDQYAFDRLWA
jgi:ketosteroid isomerase-like protein